MQQHWLIFVHFPISICTTYLCYLCRWYCHYPLTLKHALPVHSKDYFWIFFKKYWRYFLEIEVARTNKGLYFNQPKYVLEILECALMKDCKSISTLLSTKPNLHHTDEASIVLYGDSYRSIMGAFQFLTMTRPNLSYVVNLLCLMLAPSTIHHQVVRRDFVMLSKEYIIGYELWLKAHFFSLDFLCWFDMMSKYETIQLMLLYVFWI